MKTPAGPSLNHSIGFNDIRNHSKNNKCITIICSNYLKNLRDELLEEEDGNPRKNSNEIIYITAEINSVQTKIMIDTGANVSLIDAIELNKIIEEGKKHILTLPISNIVLIGATGRQNRTVRKQARLELTSNNKTIPMTFLVASGLPFNMLIGCDMLKQYSAIIDMNRSKLLLKINQTEWTADLVNSDSTTPTRVTYHIQRNLDQQEQSPSNNICLLYTSRCV